MRIYCSNCQSKLSTVEETGAVKEGDTLTCAACLRALVIVPVQVIEEMKCKIINYENVPPISAFPLDPGEALRAETSGPHGVPQLEGASQEKVQVFDEETLTAGALNPEPKQDSSPTETPVEGTPHPEVIPVTPGPIEPEEPPAVPTV